MLQNPNYHHEPSNFRNMISEESLFPPEPNRYILYVAYGCPFCHRTLMLWSYKGLEKIIKLSVVHGTFQYTNPENPEDKNRGFVFRDPDSLPLSNTDGYGSISCEGCIPDCSNKHFKSIREIYKGSNDENGKYSVPILWDTKEEVIVNNDSGDIMRILNNAFNIFAEFSEINLFPVSLNEEIEKTNKWLSENITDLVYKVGLSKTQNAYESAITVLFDGLEILEVKLCNNLYLNGEMLTGSDIRLFSTLIRFDDIYYLLFKCNKKRIAEFPNLLNFCREIYQLPRIKETFKLNHAKSAYFTNFVNLNPYGIIPVDMGFESLLSQPSNRKLMDKQEKLKKKMQEHAPRGTEALPVVDGIDYTIFYLTPQSQNTLHKLGKFVFDKYDPELLDLGPYEFEHRAVYIGQWKNGKKHGQGSEYWPTGYIFEGYSENGMSNGKGRLIYPKGNYYEGEWKNDKANGYGVSVDIYGTKYEGNWVADKKQGFGVETSTNGEKYEGNFENDQKNGKGQYVWADGSTYDGEFSNNMKHGNGRYVDVNKRVYEGEWKNNKKNGHGIDIWPDGKRFEGNFVEDRKEGVGKFVWPDGKSYHGLWSEDKINGEGKLIKSDGQVIESIWKDGVDAKNEFSLEDTI